VSPAGVLYLSRMRLYSNLEKDTGDLNIRVIVPPLSRAPLSFVITADQVYYVFSASSPNQKAAWVEAIENPTPWYSSNSGPNPMLHSSPSGQRRNPNLLSPVQASPIVQRKGSH
jgi:hypothetical protein